MSTRPNILLITTDQERYPLGFPAAVSLPAREWLRENGTTFEQYYVTTAPCTPSRSCMYTGQHVPHTGMFDNAGFPFVTDLADKEGLKTIGHMLREQGYYTAYKGKWHLSSLDKMPYGRWNEQDILVDLDGNPQVQTFEDALEPYGFADFNRAGDLSSGQHGGYLGDRGVAAEAVAWLQEKGSAVDQSWLLAVNFQNPHDVMFARTSDEQAPQMFEMVYPPDTPPFDQDWSPAIPASFDDDLSSKPQAHRDYLAGFNFAFGKQPRSADPDGAARLKRHLNYYINAAIAVDEHIGTILEGLKSAELLANTIIIFTSDHGEMGGAHGLTQKGGLPYRENLQVPLIIVHPDIEGGQSVNGVASALDLAPTILSFAQTPPAQYPALKGVDLTPALMQPANGTPRSNRIGGLLATYDSVFTADLDFARAIIERGPRQTGGPTLVEHIRTLPPPKPWQGLNRHLILDLSGRTVMRMVFDGRYKFIRYFAINDYHVPFDWHTLIEHNDIELYDLAEDPNEMVNLAYGERREIVRPLIMQMNRKLNALISHEIGEDKAVVPPWFIRVMTFLKRRFPSGRPTVQEEYT